MQSYQRMPKNFITPHVIRVEQHGNKILELSSSKGIDGIYLWGVSEFEKAATHYGLQSTERSACFDSLKEADKYYSILKIT